MSMRNRIMRGHLVAWILLTAVPPDGLPAEARGGNSFPPAAGREAEQGTVQVAAKIEPSPARLSDEIILTLTVTCRPGMAPQFPHLGHSTGDFAVREGSPPSMWTEGGQEIHQQRYLLEPTRTGSLSIAPIRIVCSEGPAGTGNKKQTVETKLPPIEVTSVVKELPSLETLRGLAGPVEVSEDPPGNLAWYYLLLAPVAIGALGLWGWWFLRRIANVSLVSPYGTACRELDRLLEEGWLHRDIKLFYVLLSGLVRRYLKQVTGIQATEQTTVEFLQEIGNRRSFAAQVQTRLKRFLESADLVKFAAYRPAKEQIDTNIEEARSFLRVRVEEAAA